MNCRMRSAWILVLCLLGLAVLPVQAKARLSTVTITYDTGSVRTKSSVFRIYLAAGVSENGEIIDNPYHLKSFDAKEAEELAGTIMKPVRTVSLHGGGAVVENMPCGIYLLAGETVTDHNRTYTPVPSFFSVPSSSGSSVYEQINIEVKYTMEEEVLYRLVKQWVNDAGVRRTDLIRAVIYEDGRRKMTVPLSDDNQWTCVFWGKKGKAYDVKEVFCPYGYTPSLAREGNTFVLINTYRANPNTADHVDTETLAMILLLGLMTAFAAVILLEEKNDHE